MRILANFQLLAALAILSACSAPDRPLEASPSAANARTTNMRNPQSAANGGEPTNLDDAAPLTDQELDRLLDALEHGRSRFSPAASSSPTLAQPAWTAPLPPPSPALRRR